MLALLDRKVHEIDRLMSELKELQQELMRLREESATRVDQSGRICGIVERGIHSRGEAALTWLEGVRKRDRKPVEVALPSERAFENESKEKKGVNDD